MTKNNYKKHEGGGLLPMFGTMQKDYEDGPGTSGDPITIATETMPAIAESLRRMRAKPIARPMEHAALYAKLGWKHKTCGCPLSK